MTFHAAIVCDNDGIESDNTSAEITVANMAPAVPYVRDLSAVPSDNSVELSWSASDVTSKTAGNNVVVTGLTTGTVTVISPDGRCLTTAKAAPVVTLPLAHGIYIVNAGNTTAKIVIK